MSAGRSYSIEIKPSAAAVLAALPTKDRRKVAEKIDGLRADPRPPRAEKLQGATDIYRIRSGDYRVLYQIVDDRLLVLVIRIGHRRDVYRNL